MDLEEASFWITYVSIFTSISYIAIVIINGF